MVEDEEAEEEEAVVGGVEEDDEAGSGDGVESISIGVSSAPFSLFLSSGEVEE